MKIDRRQNARGAWTYNDSAVHETAASLLQEHGISLVKIDDWIEAGPWDAKQLERVMEFRDRLLNASNDDAAEGWGMFLGLLAGFNIKLVPLAREGKKRGEQLVEFAVKGAAARRKYTDADHTRWRETAAEIQTLRASAAVKPLSKRALAGQVSKRLGLAGDAVEAIRKMI